MENDFKNVKGSVCVEDDLSREHRIVDDYIQEEKARACKYLWVELIL